MLQFGKITYGKHKGNKTVIIKADFGSEFMFTMREMMSVKAKNLFIKLYNTEVEVYEFFMLELYETLYFMLTSPYIEGIINRKAIRNVINQLKNEDGIKFMPHTEMAPEHILEKEREARDVLNYDLIKERMNFGILPHQRRLFEDYALMKAIGQQRGRLGSADPGTGKTYMSLALAEALDAPLVLIIAPGGTVESVWVDSLVGEMYKKPNPYWDSLSGKKYYGERFMVVHYEYIGKVIDELPKGKKVFLIIDESHNMNEKGTKRADQVHELINHIEVTDVVLLSGTSIKGKPIETSNIIKFSDARFTPVIEKEFGELYNNPTGLYMSILSKRYDSVKTFISKKEMVLPPSSTQPLVVKLSNSDYYTIPRIKERMEKFSEDQTKHYENMLPEYMDNYYALKDETLAPLVASGKLKQKDVDEYTQDFSRILDYYEKGLLRDNPRLMKKVNDFEKENILANLKGEDLQHIRHILTVIKYVSWKIQGEILASVVMQTRIDLAKDFAKNVDYEMLLGLTEKKVLIFSSYTSACEESYKACSKLTNVGRVYGEHLKSFDSTLLKFKKDKKMGAIAATFKSLGTGTPVLSANLTVFLDMPFKAFIYTQAINRTHRQGQDKACIFMQLLLDTGDVPNINSRNVDIIQLSKDVVEAITSNPIEVEFKHLDAVNECQLEDLPILL